MRIVYLHQYFNTPDMAGGTRSYEMARRLVRWGHEVHMVTSDRSTDRGGWYETGVDGIHVHWCPVRYFGAMGFNRRLRAFLSFAWVAARKAACLPGDMVFATSTPLTIALPAVYAARSQSIPMVFEVRDLWPEGLIGMGVLRSRPAIATARRLERFAYHNAEHCIALSPGMKEGIVATGYPENRVTVIPNSCDLELFNVPESHGRDFRTSYPWLQDRPLVVYTGALGIVNGVSYLARLAAATRRRDPEIRFLTVGTGGEEDTVRDTAKQLKVLGENFFMLPPVPKRQMPALLSAADIATCLLIDVKEVWTNSPNKAFDALAAGRPIAVNNHRGWLAEMIKEAECGLVLDPHDIESAADRLARALRDKQWLVKAGSTARRLAEERFDRDKLAADLESVLSEVVAAPPQGMAA